MAEKRSAPRRKTEVRDMERVIFLDLYDAEEAIVYERN